MPHPFRVEVTSMEAANLRNHKPVCFRRSISRLSDAIRRKSNSKDFDFIAEHSGMFSLLGLPAEMVQKLKLEDAVYMINDSRINVAGIPEDRVDELADFLIAAAG